MPRRARGIIRNPREREGRGEEERERGRGKRRERGRRKRRDEERGERIEDRGWKRGGSNESAGCRRAVWEGK